MGVSEEPDITLGGYFKIFVAQTHQIWFLSTPVESKYGADVT